MSTDLSASFNEQFMNINTKLKKRFLRKPNISEATNEFLALAIQCEHSEQPSFAGHCYVGAAKCEASAGNFLGEAEHYLTAARQFMKAEKKLAALMFYSPDRENLEASIGCFLEAFNKYPEKSLIRTSILMELVNDLISLNHKTEAETYYVQLINMCQSKSMKIMCMRNLVNFQIDCGKFDIALETANELCDCNNDIAEPFFTEIQVTRVLLSMLVDPQNELKTESLKQLCSDLLNDVESASIPFNADLKLKLQSIMISCATSDDISLMTIAADANLLLTSTQTDLLDLIIKKIKSSV